MYLIIPSALSKFCNSYRVESIRRRFWVVLVAHRPEVHDMGQGSVGFSRIKRPILPWQIQLLLLLL